MAILSYRFRIYPSKTIRAKLDEQLELCRWLYNRLLFELNKVREEGGKLKPSDTQAWGKFIQLLLFKAERAGRVLVRVNPRGISEGLSFDDTYRDYISVCRIKGKAGSGQSSEPVERRPLLLITAKAVIEGQVSSVKQEALPFTVG